MKELEDITDNMSLMERTIVKLLRDSTLTKQEIAEVFNLSEEKISEMHESAVKKMIDQFFSIN